MIPQLQGRACWIPEYSAAHSTKGSLGKFAIFFPLHSLSSCWWGLCLIINAHILCEICNIGFQTLTQHGFCLSHLFCWLITWSEKYFHLRGHKVVRYYLVFFFFNNSVVGLLIVFLVQPGELCFEVFYLAGAQGENTWSYWNDFSFEKWFLVVSNGHFTSRSVEYSP